MDNLVTTDWLADNLDADDLCLFDASYHLPDAGRDSAAEYAAGHIPGAVYLDLPNLSDPDAPFANTVPTAAQFEAHVRALGVSNNSRIVLYDASALHSAQRGWFLFQLYGAANVAVLDGGLPKWQAEGRAVTRDVPSPAPGDFIAIAHPEMLRNKADIAAIVANGSARIVDARGAPRFTGTEPESRPGVAAGHIPGSANLPIGQMFEPDGTLKDAAALTALFAGIGVDPAGPVVTTCGSGVTAAVISHALTRLGNQKIALYDGSWAEWGADPDTPKATGAAQ